MAELTVKLWIETVREKLFVDELEKLCKRHCKNEHSYHFTFK